MEYIPLYIIREYLQRYYERYHRCTTIFDVLPTVCQEHSELMTQTYRSPYPASIENLSDEQFMECFFQSLYPVGSTLTAAQDDDPYSYHANTIFSIDKFFQVFLHENFVKQHPHSHDYFEITYVFRGNCSIQFEKDTVKLEEGNVCIIAPNTMHEPFVLNNSSFVLNLSMPPKAFESAFSPILLQKSLVAGYVQSMLYQQGKPNYLVIPSRNFDALKLAAKYIVYENRKADSYSFSKCVSWLSVFICELLSHYRQNIQFFDAPKNATQLNHLLILEHIQSNFPTATLTSVSDFFHYNKSYLSRLVIQLTGKTFTKIITELKMEAGTKFLKKTDLTLDQIAVLIGYSTGDYFSKMFKKEYGISIEEYRKNGFQLRD